MEQPHRYVEDLRAVGQAVESFQLKVFDIEVDGKDYLVWSPGMPAGSRFARTEGSSEDQPFLVARLSPDDVNRWESAGKGRRHTPNAKPDPYAPSQVLRAVGAYLEIAKAGQLYRISKAGSRVIIQYETEYATSETIELAISQLYDIFVRMYLGRGDQPEHTG